MTKYAATLLDRLIGEETHLERFNLQPLVQLAALDAMRRAVAAGLEEEGAQVLQIILLIWQQQTHKRSISPYVVAVEDTELEDLTGLSEEQLETGLRQLLGFVRVDDVDLYLVGDIELSLDPLLNGGDGGLAERLDLVFRTSHARALIEAVTEAEAGVECYLGQLEARVDPQAGERLERLQTRWRTYLANRRFARPLELKEVRGRLADLEDEAGELAAIHDAFAGLLARTDEYAAVFSELYRASPGARLQVLRSSHQVTERFAVQRREGLRVVK